MKPTAYRRKREGTTDYRKRLRLLLGGRPRVVIRKSLNHIGAQLVKYGPAGDEVLASAHSQQIKKLGWKFSCGNIPAAYLTGLLLGMRIRGKVKESYLDMGRADSVKGSRIYACAKGIQDGGVQMHLHEEVAPAGDRIAGKHIEDYAAKSAGGRQFSEYLKNKADVRALAREVERMKMEIEKHGTA